MYVFLTDLETVLSFYSDIKKKNVPLVKKLNMRFVNCISVVEKMQLPKSRSVRVVTKEHNFWFLPEAKATNSLYMLELHLPKSQNEDNTFIHIIQNFLGTVSCYIILSWYFNDLPYWFPIGMQVLDS